MRIRLNAADRLVGYFEMPHYNPMPEVVTLASRIFKMRTVIADAIPGSENGALFRIAPVEPPPQDDAGYIYDECFAVAITSERQDG